MTKVLFIWKPNDELIAHLREHLPEVEFIVPPDKEEGTFIRLAPEVDIIIGWRPSVELLMAAKDIKLFINPGAGVQQMVKAFIEAEERGRKVTLVNCHGNAYYTAQGGMALLLSLMDRTIPHHNWMMEGKWRTGDNDAVSIPLRGRSIGFLGYGHVNRMMHKFLSGFDVEFHALKTKWGNDLETFTPVERYVTDELHDFLRVIDVLIMAIPRTPKTVGMIGREELALLGPGSYLINIGRGDVLDEDAVYEALRDGAIAGAAIDVWYDYRPEADEAGRKFPYSRPFHELDNIVMSPHRAYSPFDDISRWDEAIENIRRLSAGREDLINIVDIHEGY